DLLLEGTRVGEQLEFGALDATRETEQVRGRVVGDHPLVDRIGGVVRCDRRDAIAPGRFDDAVAGEPSVVFEVEWRLGRSSPHGADERLWNPQAPAPGLLDGVDAVVHLAGASIAGRFTDGHRAAIRDSRIEPTRLLATAAASAADGPRTFISASAIGFYGYDRGDTQLTEDSTRGDGFLADVVSDWEAATAPAADAGLRVVRVRTGIVQAAAGGTLRLLRPLFSAGLGGPVAGGRQWLSWIGLDDLLDIYHRALYDERLDGPVNAVGVDPVRNSEYTRELARVLHRPAVLPVPSLGPRVLLGAQGARELAEASQRVVPSKLLAVGHRFRHPDLADALAHQLGRG
ncbi:TIGR01777 family oxidoreductase, partial [Mycolicibacterium hippocampi]|uniref:TIGR01777 family oxidoreductase n=1 Tax=Mycolicibacterium hippocampi TaxID=659824 RepID=UPI0035628A5A